MKAMIFAAGLGTRLKPITDSVPKALVEIDGKPLLFYAIQKLKRSGITAIIINVHHFAKDIIQYIERNNRFDIDIEVSDESDLLLDTGGGLFNARSFFSDHEPFIVYNVDVLSSIDLVDLVGSHRRSGAIATTAVMRRNTSRYLLFDEHMSMCGWRNRGENKEIITREATVMQEYAFSGIQVLNKDVFVRYSPAGRAFSILDMYLELSKLNDIKAYDHSGDLWLDLGKISELEKAGDLIKNCYK